MRGETKRSRQTASKADGQMYASKRASRRKGEVKEEGDRAGGEGRNERLKKREVSRG